MEDTVRSKTVCDLNQEKNSLSKSSSYPDAEYLLTSRYLSIFIILKQVSHVFYFESEVDLLISRRLKDTSMVKIWCAGGVATLQKQLIMCCVNALLLKVNSAPEGMNIRRSSQPWRKWFFELKNLCR